MSLSPTEAQPEHVFYNYEKQALTFIGFHGFDGTFSMENDGPIQLFTNRRPFVHSSDVCAIRRLASPIPRPTTLFILNGVFHIDAKDVEEMCFEPSPAASTFNLMTLRDFQMQCLSNKHTLQSGIY